LNLGLSTGRLDALDLIKARGALLVMTNLDFLDRVAEALPGQADRVAEIRARAAKTLTPAHTAAIASKAEKDVDLEPEYDAETGEVPYAVRERTADGQGVEPDPITQKVAERRGAAPADMAASDAMPM
jgi:hypothetical protein